MRTWNRRGRPCVRPSARYAFRVGSPLLLALLPLAVLLATVAFVVVRDRRGGASKHAPTSEPSAIVLLEANLWEACSVDGVLEPWARLATEEVRGFCGVTSGRHRIVTTTPTGEASLDVVVYPGEVLAWRLDVSTACWQSRAVDADTRSRVEIVPASGPNLALATGTPKMPGWLVHLRTTMNLVRSRPTAPPTKADEDLLARVERDIARLLTGSETDPSEAKMVRIARAVELGERLVGRALTRRDIRALVSPIREHAEKASARGDVDRASHVVDLGLAILPEDPELLVLSGGLLAARGRLDEALRVTEAALERDRCLEATDAARALRLRAELRMRLAAASATLKA